jgi:hypothetical protein
MKHILPILTITTLAAAASAQTAAASSGLSYNNASVSYSQYSASGFSGHANNWALSANALIGSSNVLISASTQIGGDVGNGGDTVALGYVFKNLAAGTDVIVSVGSDETYALTFRKDLGNNLEAAAGISRVLGENVYGLSVGYSVSKAVTLSLGYQRSSSVDASDYIAGATNVKLTAWTASVRYNF